MARGPPPEPLRAAKPHLAEMYSADMGRPNRAVQTVLGVLVLKEMFDPTNATWSAPTVEGCSGTHLRRMTTLTVSHRSHQHDGGWFPSCQSRRAKWVSAAPWR